MKKYFYAIFLFVSAACSEEAPTVNLGIDDVYRIARMQKLELIPVLTGGQYVWKVDGKVVADTRRYIFLAAEEGSYNLEFDIVDPETPYHYEFRVDVMHEEVEYSPYISKVFEYCPAPGQFINEMPAYEPGDDAAAMAAKATDCISGKNDVMISLGAFGGYVTFGFDHTVVNVKGEYDFRIWGNSFYELTGSERKGGSAEAGIVMVSYDENCNGLPDDPFYELAGSAFADKDTKHNYTICYGRPDPASDTGAATADAEYIKWTDSDGGTGYIEKNIFHKQSYWPQWVDAEQMSFTGTCLPPNAHDSSGMGRYYILYCFDWGYVDNHPNDYADLNSFDISWAVDADGFHVELSGIDFVRVYTGLNQYCGWIGETSTELCRAADLHVDDPATQVPVIPLSR